VRGNDPTFIKASEIMGILVTISILLSLYFYYIRFKRPLVIISIFILLLLMGFDEILINRVVNPPKVSCKIDDDCKVEVIGSTGAICVNKGWEYYNSILQVLAYSEYEQNCVCRENVCQRDTLELEKPKIDLNKSLY
jgi:hypothetical protein